MNVYGHPDSREDVEFFIAKHYTDKIHKDNLGRYVFCLRDVFDAQSMHWITLVVRSLSASGNTKIEFERDTPEKGDHYLYVTVQ